MAAGIWMLALNPWLEMAVAYFYGKRVAKRIPEYIEEQKAQAVAFIEEQKAKAAAFVQEQKHNAVEFVQEQKVKVAEKIEHAIDETAHPHGHPGHLGHAS